MTVVSFSLSPSKEEEEQQQQKRPSSPPSFVCGALIGGRESRRGARGTSPWLLYAEKGAAACAPRAADPKAAGGFPSRGFAALAAGAGRGEGRTDRPPTDRPPGAAAERSG